LALERYAKDTGEITGNYETRYQRLDDHHIYPFEILFHRFNHFFAPPVRWSRRGAKRFKALEK
jgi:hypothetical protein